MMKSLIALVFFGLGHLAHAQVPPHRAGTVCYTETIEWCSIVPPAAPGTDCVCRSFNGPDGYVAGRVDAMPRRLQRCTIENGQRVCRYVLPAN